MDFTVSRIAQRISDAADSLLGRPYRERGRGPEYDCFGLYLALCRRLGIELADPFTATSLDRRAFRGFYKRFRCMGRDAVLRPLDLLLQRHERQHVAVAVEPGWVLDTDRYAGAHRAPLRSVKRITGIYRLRCLEE